MPYAVLQKDLEPPTLEQLKQAFRQVPGLTEMDAFTLGKHACGILLRGVGQDEAAALQSALAAQGIGTDVVDETVLPALPQGRNVNRLECRPEGLIIYDPLNRPVTVNWSDLMLVAAGKVPLQEFKQVQREIQVSDGDGGTITKTETETREERKERLLLEIILCGATMRLSANADKSPMLFNYLCVRKTKDLLQNFKLLVQDLAQYAPHVAVNRGAYYLREGADQSFDYPGKTAFYSEITWLLWQLKQVRNAGG